MKTQTHISALAPTCSRRRRGVILLVVMGFLALLTMVAVTYVIASREFKMTARAATAAERYDTGFQEQLDRAFRQIIRGSQNPYSAVSIHSLLEDLYGNDAYQGVVASATWDSDGKGWLFVDVAVNPSDYYTDPRPIPHYYTGRVLTFTDGPLRNASFRVISYEPNGSGYRFALLPVTVPVNVTGMVPGSGTPFLVNGRPLNGSGFGYNTSTGNITSAALLPNAAHAGTDLTQGGADEDYDIPDYNNFHLAARVWNTNNSRWEVRSPSFFNPALLNWHRANNPDVTSSNEATRAEAKRKFMLRPLEEDHPNFTGSNPYHEYLNNLELDRDGNGIPDLIWDVDNDGDGLPDSVWVDLGMPVQLSADGKYYKPLFAVLILDMDSRLNVNTHGSDRHVAELVPFYFPAAATNFDFGRVESYPDASNPPFPEAMEDTWNNYVLPGMGAGPAEVNPLPIIDADEFKALLFGIRSNGLVGRYGELDKAPTDLASGEFLRAGWTDTWRDTPTTISGLPPIRNDNKYNLDAYDGQNPRHPWVDLDGDMGVMLTYAGRPIKAPRLQQGSHAVPPTIGFRNVNVDPDDREHPYHLNPYREVFTEEADRAEWVDAPFSMRDAEVFLRPADVDSSALPRRLLDLIPTVFASAKKRGQITAESYTIPVPTYAPTPLMRQLMQDEGKLTTNLSFPEFVYWRIRVEYVRRGETISESAAWDLVKDLFAKRLFARELILGQKWNPTQGGIDRTEYARQLYMLAMLVLDLPETHSDAYDHGVAKRLAQWAINVVDFADDDRIMTGFEYDLNPFYADGGASSTWNVDNVIGDGSLDDNLGHRGIAWGAEKPELLITETFACHDTRTEDLDNEDVAVELRAKRTAPVNPDDDFDQRRRPQGSVFLELFNPDLATAVDLDQLTGNDGDPVRTPVWQILLVRGRPPILDDKEYGHLDPTWPRWSDAERVVWFITESRLNAYVPLTIRNAVNFNGVSRLRYSSLSAFNPADPDYYNELRHSGDAAYYEQLTRWTFQVPAGGFTVIGPRVRTRFGRSGPGGTNNNLLTIRLIDRDDETPWTPDAVVAHVGGSPLESVIDRDAYWVDYPRQDYDHRDDDQIRRVKGIVINAPQPLNVTEPPDGYPEAMFTTPDPDDPAILYRDAYGNEMQDNPYPDAPFPIEGGFSRMVGTYEEVFGVYLQRIADPSKPFDPVTNPYLTVDYAPMDLHVFNGETDWEYLMTHDPDQDGRTIALKFQTRERWDPSGQFNIWRQSFTSPSLASTGDPFNPTTERRPHLFRHSLGFLPGFRNKPASPPDFENPNHWFAQNGIWQEGQAYAAFDVRDGANNLLYRVNLLGWPKAPIVGMARDYTSTTPWFYPWFGWFNRPYVNPMELLQVPASTPSRLLYEFHMEPDHNAYSGHNPFVGTDPPYRHLLNFFQTQLTANPLVPSGLHRMFDFIDTPSRFHGSKLFDAEGDAHPLYRDPGRVNINTVFDNGDIWAALFNRPERNSTVEAHWRHTWESRQGYGTGTVGQLKLQNDSPTFFNRPFRAFNHQRQKPYTDPDPEDELHSTIFRKHPAPASTARPLLASKTVNDASDSILNANLAYIDGDRHPFFRYQPLSRIANNYATTSNVYAVWVTVGYFEAEPVRRSTVYPDGFRYGKELGADTGDVVRHRGFFIYDRSIPVGFQRGEDLNSDQGILIRRIIE